MKNFEIANANNALAELIDEKIKGKFKFKLFKIKVELESKMTVLSKALEGVEDVEERTEIFNEEQEVNCPKLTEEELEDLPLSIKQLSALQPIIKKENE